MTNAVKSIADTCVLVVLGISQPKLTAVDRAATEKATAEAGAKAGRGKLVKVLFSDEDYKPIRTLVNEMRSFHRRMTMPWIDAGPRILPASLYMEYADFMRKYREQWDRHVDEFVAAYEERLERAQNDLNGWFNRADYPDPCDVKRRFGLNVHVLPVAAGGDFRVKGFESEAVSLDAENLQVAQRAMEEVKGRMMQVIKTMASNLTSGARVYDTLVTNVTDLCELLPHLNITGDEGVDQFREEMEKLVSSVHPDDLRKDKAYADSVGKEAQKVADKMAAYFG